MSRYRGVVRWFNNAKGYGFLGRDGGPDVFVHYSAIEKDGYKTLKEGDQVEYNVIAGAQGRPQADHVACISRASMVSPSASMVSPSASMVSPPQLTTG